MTHELRKIRDSCGQPSYKVIGELSAGFDLDRNAAPRRPLATATVGNIFNSDRLPSWKTVAPILWACYRYAKEQRVLDLDPADATRTAWNRLVEIANPAPALHGTSQSSGQSPAIATDTPSPGHEKALTSASLENFSAEERWYLNTYGQIGADLFRAASTGESEAAYRLGVVTTVDRHPRRARDWLAMARDLSHTDASELLASAPGTKKGQALAAEHAYWLGYTAHHGFGDRDQAIFYYKYAAKQKHSDAAYNLAHIYCAAGELGDAARWFSIAGRGENLDAKRQLSLLQREMGSRELDEESQRSSPPSPTRDPSPGMEVRE
ncbi:hypothetical protein [Streptosporangium sp. NPDC051022]|uniref:hypothetical protein n=1 Tax=Streptosporangium sp. NPDC051022 TaxID=3155752 RepID=UPI003413D23F